jgi:hypothetical protein
MNKKRSEAMKKAWARRRSKYITSPTGIPSKPKRGRPVKVKNEAYQETMKAVKVMFKYLVSLIKKDFKWNK